METSFLFFEAFVTPPFSKGGRFIGFLIRYYFEMFRKIRISPDYWAKFNYILTIM